MNRPIKDPVQVIREIPCEYCENKANWVCPECTAAICTDCSMEEYMGKCPVDCFENLPNMVDVSLAKKTL